MVFQGIPGGDRVTEGTENGGNQLLIKFEQPYGALAKSYVAQ